MFIYAIINKKNSKCYIGSTINTDERFIEHKKMIENKNHQNKNIKKDSLIYSVNDFEFIILSKYENLTRKSVYLIEKKWIDFLCYHDILYNITNKTLGFKNSYCITDPIERKQYRMASKIEGEKIVELIHQSLFIKSIIDIFSFNNSECPF